MVRTHQKLNSLATHLVSRARGMDFKHCEHCSCLQGEIQRFIARACHLVLQSNTHTGICEPAAAECLLHTQSTGNRHVSTCSPHGLHSPVEPLVVLRGGLTRPPNVFQFKYKSIPPKASQQSLNLFFQTQLLGKRIISGGSWARQCWLVPLQRSPIVFQTCPTPEELLHVKRMFFTCQNKKRTLCCGPTFSELIYSLQVSDRQT